MLARRLPTIKQVARKGPQEACRIESTVFGRKTMSYWTRRIMLGATLLVAAAGSCRSRLGPDQAEMGARLRGRRALSHRGAVGGRGDQEAHQRQVRDRRVSRPRSSATRTRSTKALGLGTVDMIYTGVAFAGSIHKPIAITNAPFVLRDFDHFMAYRDEPAVPRHRQGLRGQDQAQGDHADLLRPAHGDGEQGDQEAGRHEGHEAARAAGAACS